MVLVRKNLGLCHRHAGAHGAALLEFERAVVESTVKCPGYIREQCLLVF